MKKINKISVVIVSILQVFVLSHAKSDIDYGNWEKFHGGGSPATYRFVQSYAKMEDGRRQRVDFTFTKNSWKFYITLPLVPNTDPVIVALNIDGESFIFKDTSAMNKIDWDISPKLLDALLKTKSIIIIDQKYTGGGDFQYKSTLNYKGLANAMRWAIDI
jgi:hypothetical protein